MSDDGHRGATDIASIMEQDVASLSIPTRLEWVGKASEFLRQRAVQCGVCDADRAERLVIALHEALTNAIVHGNLGISSALKEQPGDAFAKALAERSADPMLSARRVDVRFSFDGERCQIRIADEGDGFDYQKWLADDDGPPSLQCSGRGILMMKAFVDDVSYGDGGREVVLTLLPPQGVERRSAPRRPRAEAVRVMPTDGQGTSPQWHGAWDALTQDVSQTGIRLIQSGEHAAHRVIVEFRTDGRPVYVPAEVCRVTPLKDGLFELGCRFTPPAPPAEDPAPPIVAKLLAGVDERTQKQERRAYARIPYTAHIEVRRPGEAGFRAAFSRDLSRGGIAFVTSFELPLGPVELTLPVPGEPGQLVTARVVRCQRVTAGVYDVGCQFIGTAGAARNGETRS